MLTVTTAAKYVKITDGTVTKRILYAQIKDITNNATHVLFSTTDPQFVQSVGYSLAIKDIDTFDSSNQFTADSIAEAILAKVIA